MATPTFRAMPVVKQQALLGQSAGVALHGTTATATVNVYDRSAMALLTAEPSGLGNIRATLQNLGWQGGHLAIYKRLNTTYYTNFEDYPDNFPNNSIDYPDIQSDQVLVIKDPNGTAQNPRFNPITLNPPLVKDAGTGQLRGMLPSDAMSARIFQPTVFNFAIDVPRFQPANTNAQASLGGALVPNSAGVNLAQGYLGRAQIFVDSNGNGVLDNTPSEALSKHQPVDFGRRR